MTHAICFILAHRGDLYMQGIISALVTPFQADGGVDWEAFAIYLDWQLSFSPDAVLALGSTAEANLLSVDECCEILKFVCQHAHARGVKVMAGCGTPSTTHTLELAKQYELIGADALLVVTPFYVRPTQLGLIAHYSFLAENLKTPIILYNVPSRTGVDMSLTTMQELFTLPQIRGVKEASGDLNKMRSLCVQYPKHLIYSGDDVTCADALMLGASGVISVVSNDQPQLMHALFANCSDQALNLQWQNQHKQHLEYLGQLAPNPVVIKAMLADRGMMRSTVRLPLLPLTDAQFAELAGRNRVVFESK